MHERTERLKSFDGTDLYFRCYTPQNKDLRKNKIDGLILCVHGFAEYSGRYENLAKFVCEKHMAFVSFDLRGHGKSGPIKGDAENLHALILDVLYIVNHARAMLGISKNPNIFFGLFGHSFGALLVTYAAAILRDLCPPIFLSSPCYSLKNKPNNIKKLFAKSIPKILTTLNIINSLDYDKISNNQENNLKCRNDLNMLKTYSIRYGQIVLEGIDDNRLRHALSMVHANVQIIAAGDDQIVDTEITKQLFSLFSSDETNLKIIDKAGHEIFNEVEEYRNIALNYFGQWIDNKGIIL